MLDLKPKAQALIERFRPQIVKLRAVHSKNPFTVQKLKPLMPEERYRPRVLDGYFILKESKAQLPSEVVTLNVAEKNITKLDDENFQYFSSLIEVNISHNHLQLSNSFSKFENLEVLNMQGNNILEITADLSNFQKLRVLNLSFNFLQKIDELLVLGELKELNVSDNVLRQLPLELQDFYLLENFDLGGNQFTSDHMAAEFFKALSSVQLLKSLFIARNRFKGFHTEQLK